MTHHPLILVAVAWWALLAFTLRLDASAIVVGIAPTLAVTVGYFLAQRQRRAIAREAEAAAAKAETTATQARKKVAEVHKLVNSQRDELEAKNAALEAKNVELEKRISTLEGSRQ